MKITERHLYVLLETTKDTLGIRGGDFSFSAADREAAVMAVIDSMEQKPVEVGGLKESRSFIKRKEDEPDEPVEEQEVEGPTPTPPRKVGKLARPRP